MVLKTQKLFMLSLFVVLLSLSEASLYFLALAFN